MAEAKKVPASQQLRDTATKQEGVLEGVNTFKPDSNEYGANNKEVIDAANGTPTDISTRLQNEGVNYFNASNEYKSPE